MTTEDTAAFNGDPAKNPSGNEKNPSYYIGGADAVHKDPVMDTTEYTAAFTNNLAKDTSEETADPAKDAAKAKDTAEETADPTKDTAKDKYSAQPSQRSFPRRRHPFY